jgi:uncharacterized protein YkwD
MDAKVRTGLVAGLSVFGVAVALVVSIVIAASSRDSVAPSPAPEPVPPPPIHIAETKRAPRAPEPAPPANSLEETAPPSSMPVRPSLPDIAPPRVPRPAESPLARPSTRPEHKYEEIDDPVFFHPVLIREGSTPEPLNPGKIDPRILARLNAFRALAGQPAVVVDPALSEGCVSHARYLVLHHGEKSTAGLGVHKETAGLAGYTPNGDTAAQHSVITMVEMGAPALPEQDWPVAELDKWMASLYHRVPVLSPTLRRVGIGYASNDKKTVWYTVLDVGADPTVIIKGVRRPVTPVLYPGDNQSEVPRAFGRGAREVPDPLPAGRLAKDSGFPITVSFPPKMNVRGVTATLRRESKSDDGKTRMEEVPFWFSTPEKPAGAADQENTVCLIAKDRLAKQTTYRVTVEATVNGQAWKGSWKFTTGREL